MLNGGRRDVEDAVPYRENGTDWSRVRILKIMFNEDRRDVEDTVPYREKEQI